MDSVPTPPPQNIGTRVRRPRTARACDACRAKKNRCDDAYPCTYCRKHNLDCVYMGQDIGRRYTSDYVRGLEDEVKRLGALKDSLAQDQLIVSPNHVPSSQPTGPASRDGPGLEPQNDHQQHQAQRSHVSTQRQGRSSGQEVSAVNRHTRNVEFYGSSSAFALLSHVQRAGGAPTAPTDAEHDDSIVSNLHNPAFSPASEQLGPLGGTRQDSPNCRSSPYYPQCRSFILSFFSSIHYVHPILSKAEFLGRCDQLLSGQHSSTETSFVALYYSILSLGALVGPRDDDPIDGIPNLQWSRAFFDEAVRRCHKLGMVTDLDMVHCYFFLAKVCQNELNPHSARTALAMGINREPRNQLIKDASQLRAESRTWWGLYSLEVEMSFSVGRPDTLGADLYHNRRFPVIEGKEGVDSTTTNVDLLEPSNCAIIKSMVDLSRIVKNIGLEIYLSEDITLRTVDLAFRLQTDLDKWADSVPPEIRPRLNAADLVSLKSARAAQWIKRQRLVLTLRYLNLRILMFGSFLLPSSPTERASIMRSQETQRGIQICIDSAKSTIEIIFMMYQHHDFFRTW
ncbi:hypothetical protein MAC_08222 [Metarhizium acridum CQMa 102]|uniref:Zn(2)-C6 fungal-type domain-containing protein n=1 Tax=Metarhizium acridum (strain CQMa 102) TaxID=655827 RepID=E9EEC4_METAQ|nr:uncharacterized protein MAC_08222 [Metarhizium acridum CQMa 102]EFY85752.1 hypothetical protein MAC_08222 [Metarhizium acridum CQMa 102]